MGKQPACSESERGERERRETTGYEPFEREREREVDSAISDIGCGYAASERVWHMQDSHGQILALSFR